MGLCCQLPLEAHTWGDFQPAAALSGLPFFTTASGVCCGTQHEVSAAVMAAGVPHPPGGDVGGGRCACAPLDGSTCEATGAAEYENCSPCSAADQRTPCALLGDVMVAAITSFFQDPRARSADHAAVEYARHREPELHGTLRMTTLGEN